MSKNWKIFWNGFIGCVVFFVACIAFQYFSGVQVLSTKHPETYVFIWFVGCVVSWWRPLFK